MTDFYKATIAGATNLSACSWGACVRITKTAVDGTAVEFSDGSQGFSLQADSGEVFGTLTTSDATYETPRWTIVASDVDKEYAVLCSYSGSDLKLTVQGVAVGTNTPVVESSIAVTGGEFAIGNAAAGGDPIDGMAVWGVVWSADSVDGSESLAWYNSCVDSSNLIADIAGQTEERWDGFPVRFLPGAWAASTGDLDLTRQGTGAQSVLFSQAASWGTIPDSGDIEDFDAFYGMEWD